MERNEIIQRLRLIVNKAARNVSEEERGFLLWLAETLSVERAGKSGCVKCWHDLAVRCYDVLTAEEPAQTTNAKYVLKSGVDVYFGNIRVNAATLTDELAERIIARGFDIKYFAKC